MYVDGWIPGYRWQLVHKVNLFLVHMMDILWHSLLILGFSAIDIRIRPCFIRRHVMHWTPFLTIFCVNMCNSKAKSLAHRVCMIAVIGCAIFVPKHPDLIAYAWNPLYLTNKWLLQLWGVFETLATALLSHILYVILYYKWCDECGMCTAYFTQQAQHIANSYMIYV